MNDTNPFTHTAFLAGSRLASGSLSEVAVAVLRAQQTQPEKPVLVFCDSTGQSADLDLRGGELDVAERYAVAVPVSVPKARGRPKLGVVPREVTLMPAHWEWLATQPGGASVALRKLVHEAMRSTGEQGRTRRVRDRAYHAMSTLAGDLPGFEEASRALYSDDCEQLTARMAPWPPDVRAYVLQLAELASD